MMRFCPPFVSSRIVIGMAVIRMTVKTVVIDTEVLGMPGDGERRGYAPEPVMVKVIVKRVKEILK